jgi:quercetin dioxygenase-like cupin family protein
MATFYDDWLASGERHAGHFARSPMIAHDREIPWVQTRQDARVKLLVSRGQGFPTMGSNVLKAEIPPGWHSGKHSHGEESFHILQGRGFSIIAGQRFDWHAGSSLHIPYRAEHQHFNTGDEPVLYVSGMCFELEDFVHIAQVEQLEDCGPNDPARLAELPAETSQYYPDGRRAIIHLEDAPSDGGDDPTPKLAANVDQFYDKKFLVVPRNGFKATSVAVTHVLSEPAGYHGGRHKHLEAVLYVLQGEGYTEVEGREVRWETGDVLHVPPANYEHEHYNDSGHDHKLLRIQFGIRYWFTNLWPEGYTAQRIYDEFGKPIVAGRIERVRERA